MKLFYSKGACSLTVRIIINALGLEAVYESVDLKTKLTETGQDFWAINPKGSVPVLQLDNGKFLSENQAILQYLVDNNSALDANQPLLSPIGDFKRYRALEWLSYVATEVHKAFGPVFNPKLTDAEKQEAIPVIKAKIAFIEQHLQQNKFLAGDSFTLADAYLFVVLRWTKVVKIDLAEWPRLADYFKRLHQENAIQMALEQEGLEG